MSENIKSVTLLDCQKGEVVMIKFTEDELQEMKQYDVFSVFLSTLEDIYQFKMSNCSYMTSGEEPKIRKIGFETTDEEYAQEVLRTDVLKSDVLEDYYHTRRDSCDNLNKDGLENCYRATILAIERIRSTHMENRESKNE